MTYFPVGPVFAVLRGLDSLSPLLSNAKACTVTSLSSAPAMLAIVPEILPRAHIVRSQTAHERFGIRTLPADSVLSGSHFFVILFRTNRPDDRRLYSASGRNPGFDTSIWYRSGVIPRISYLP